MGVSHSSATFGTINMACNSCTPLGPLLAKLTATCVLPRNNPKQIQTNPCAISKYWSTTVQDFALKTRIFSAIS